MAKTLEEQIAEKKLELDALITQKQVRDNEPEILKRLRGMVTGMSFAVAGWNTAEGNITFEGESSNPLLVPMRGIMLLYGGCEFRMLPGYQRTFTEIHVTGSVSAMSNLCAELGWKLDLEFFHDEIDSARDEVKLMEQALFDLSRFEEG